MKKKILIIGPDPFSWGGVATCAREIENSNKMNENYIFTHLSTWKNGKWLIDFIKSLFKIKKLVNNTDLIHINLSKKGSTYRLLLLSLFFNNKKYIIHMHNGNYGAFFEKCSPFIKKQIITLMEKAKSIIFVSNYQKEEILNKTKIKNNNIKIIYNGINIVNSTPKDKDYLQVLYFGTITNNRNINEYIELANNLANNSIKFVLAGNGMINNLDLKNIDYRGFVKEKEKEEILNNSDIIFDHFSESFGLGLVEAMNHYVCPLVYPTGSILEIIGNNEYGLLFKNKNELIEKLLLLKNNKDLLNEYKEKAYKRSLIFSKEKYINSFKLLYDEVFNDE